MSNGYVDKVSAVGTVYDIHVPNGTIDRAMLDTDLQEKTDAVGDLKSAFEVLEPIATSGDVGKALIAKTVENGKVTEYEFGEAGGGISSDVKSALLACFAKVAWTDEHGQDYYDALEAALYGDTWQITNTLSHCVTSNTEDSITKGAAYSATISASSGYTLNGATVSITMGGVDITSSAYNNGTISIAAVTGSLVITVTAISIRESLFGTFENGYAVGTSVGYAGRTTTSARACPTKPFLNDGYTFAVTDPSKYQVNAVDATSDVAVEVSSSYGYVGNIAYPRGTKTVSWNSSDSVTTTYCWLALKKNDGTAFTAEELADGAAAVFTYTSN